jgi:excisionase family DNA binding protein
VAKAPDPGQDLTCTRSSARPWCSTSARDVATGFTTTPTPAKYRFGGQAIRLLEAEGHGWQAVNLADDLNEAEAFRRERRFLGLVDPRGLVNRIGNPWLAYLRRERLHAMTCAQCGRLFQSHRRDALNGQVPTASLSVTEAAQFLGVSPNTVRARIKAGRLRAERAQRPQGEVIRVYLNTDDLPTPHTNKRTTQVPPPGTSYDVPTGTSQMMPAQQAEALGRLVQEAIARIEREQGRLLDLTIEQAERIGRLEAELDHLTAASLLQMRR